MFLALLGKVVVEVNSVTTDPPCLHISFIFYSISVVLAAKARFFKIMRLYTSFLSFYPLMKKSSFPCPTAESECKIRYSKVPLEL